MEEVHGGYGGCMEMQASFMRMHGLPGCPKKWAETLSMKLLECTHGQWLYRNIIIHNKVDSTVQSLHNEHIIPLEIEAQLASEEPLSEEDQYLLEINTGDIWDGAGGFQEYWLLVIQTVRRAKQAHDHTPEGIG